MCNIMKFFMSEVKRVAIDKMLESQNERLGLYEINQRMG